VLLGTEVGAALRAVGGHQPYDDMETAPGGPVERDLAATGVHQLLDGLTNSAYIVFSSARAAR